MHTWPVTQSGSRYLGKCGAEITARAGVVGLGTSLEYNDGSREVRAGLYRANCRIPPRLPGGETLKCQLWRGVRSNFETHFQVEKVYKELGRSEDFKRESELSQKLCDVAKPKLESLR